MSQIWNNHTPRIVVSQKITRLPKIYGLVASIKYSDTAETTGENYAQCKLGTRSNQSL